MKTIKNKLIILCLIISVLPYTPLSSQQVPGKVIPYPELAREFQKYQGYPVSIATGIPDINVPLFEFKMDNYAIPFSLGYHSSGIKVTQNPGLVGHGWSLMPSFRITREIHNRDDERYLVNTNEIRSQEDIDDAFGNGNAGNIVPINDNIRYMERIAHYAGDLADPIDTEYDIFTIQLPTCSGNFILQKNNNMLQAVKINSNALKITPNIINNTLNGFDVLDEKGILYKFGYYPNENTTTEYTEYSYSTLLTSSWMLYKIVLPNSREMMFTYKRLLVDNSNILWKRDVITDNIQIPLSIDANYGLSLLGISEDKETFDEMIPMGSYNCFPKAITFPTGRVDFEYPSANSYQLNKIVLKNAAGAEVKSAVFQREVNANNRLASVSLSHGGGVYQFEYNPQTFSNLQAQDYWGYYNGTAYSAGFVPVITIPTRFSKQGFNNSTISVGWANREPSEYHMKANILEKIIYPTGGHTTFAYESNRYYDPVAGTIKIAGGLRIHTINTYDPSSGKTITKTYKYGQGESGCGTTTYIPKKEHFTKEYYVLEFGDPAAFSILSMRRRETMPHSYFEYYLNTNMSVWYNTVTEYSDGGKTVYEYAYTPDDITGSPYLLPEMLFLKHYYSYISSIPELMHRTVYKIENNVATPVHEIHNTYDFIEHGDPVKGLFVSEYIKAPVNFNRKWQSFIDGYDCSYHTSHTSADPPHGWYMRFLLGLELDSHWGGVDFPNQIFLNDNYYIHRGIRQLVSTTETEYTTAGNVSKAITYNYDATHPYNLKVKNESSSSNSIQSTRYYYPYEDIAGISPSMRNLLLNKNRYSSVIQKEIFKDNNLLITERTLYKNYANELVLPEKVQTSTTGISNLYTDISYDQYDEKGNLLQYTAKDNIPVVYLWGYNHQYPIAEIKNATYDQVKTALGYSSHSQIESLAAQTSPNVTNISNTLRNYFASSPVEVSVYEYNPLIGLTKATDPRGVITRYEYDSFGRLEEILVDGKRVQEYRYHYKE